MGKIINYICIFFLGNYCYYKKKIRGSTTVIKIFFFLYFLYFKDYSQTLKSE